MEIGGTGKAVRTIATRNHLTPIIPQDLATTPTAHIDQTAESDANLLTRLAQEYGAIATVKAIPTLRKLSLDAKAFTDADLTAVASVTQIKELSLSNLELPDTRLSQFQAFAHLKTFTLVRYGKGYPDETQTNLKALLPKVDMKFVK